LKETLTVPEETKHPASAQHHNAASEHAAAHHDREAAHHHDPDEREHTEKDAVSARILARMRTAYPRLPASIPKSR
jgi:hypothetical protein